VQLRAACGVQHGAVRAAACEVEVGHGQRHCSPPLARAFLFRVGVSEVVLLLGKKEEQLFTQERWGLIWVTDVPDYPRVRRLTQTTTIGHPNTSVWVAWLEMP
jgi:hypothetical protein